MVKQRSILVMTVEELREEVALLRTVNRDLIERSKKDQDRISKMRVHLMRQIELNQQQRREFTGKRERRHWNRMKKKARRSSARAEREAGQQFLSEGEK